MRVLAVASGKGGVGKTTTVVNLAALAARSGRVLLVDSDVANVEGSASWWVGQAGAAVDAWAPVDVVECADPGDLARLRTVAGYDWLIFDSPPVLTSEVLRTVVASADLTLVPTGPAPLDLRKLIPTIRQVVAPCPRPYQVVLARVHPSAVTAALRVQNELSAAGIQVLPSIVRAYSAHAVAPGEGLPITRVRDRNARRAEADYRAVFEDLLLCWPTRQPAAAVGA